jgi:thermitase
MRTLLTAILVTAAAVAIPAAAARADDPAGADYAPGQVTVKFRDGVDRGASLHAHGARLDRGLVPHGPVLVDLPEGQSVPDAVAAMKRDPRVEYAEPDYYRHALSLPNDPLFGQQWGLRNTGQIVHDVAGTAGDDIHAPEAWQRTTGSPDVKVAVLDSGMTWGQPDLAPNLWRNPGESGGGKESNGVDDDGDGFVDDWRGWDFVQQDNDPIDNAGHGTATSATIAARGDNGIGMAGVAWQASIIPVRVLDNNASGRCSDFAAAYSYAAKVGARVVNLSAGGQHLCQAERDAIEAAPNVLFVFGSGNDSLTTADFPCAFPSPNIVCVGATDSSDAPAGYSNFNPVSVDLAAPGTSMVVAWPKAGPVYEIFKDGFETPLDGRWRTDGTLNTWARTSTGARTGSWALTDSPQGDYAANTDSYVYLMQPLDLRGRRGCMANVQLNRKLSPNPPSSEGAEDALVAEVSVDGVNWGRRPHAITGVTSGYELWQIDLSELEGRDNPPGRFRFNLFTDDSHNYDGVYLDDFRVACSATVETYTGAADEFDYDTGTSYSAPLVSGVAVLLLSLDPGLSPADLKQKLLSSVDPIPALAGKTVTGGRLNAAKAVATIPAPSTPPAASPLAADLKALVKKLRIRALLRGLTTVRVHASGAGRLTLVVKSGKRTIAGGSRTASHAGRYSLRIKPTRRGRSLLRRSRHLQVTVALTFKSRSGPVLSQSTRLTLPR